jgi:hypothetical protein
VAKATYDELGRGYAGVRRGRAPALELLAAHLRSGSFQVR